jgi:hypothetical protein
VGSNPIWRRGAEKRGRCRIQEYYATPNSCGRPVSREPSLSGAPVYSKIPRRLPVVTQFNLDVGIQHQFFIATVAQDEMRGSESILTYQPVNVDRIFPSLALTFTFPKLETLVIYCEGKDPVLDLFINRSPALKAREYTLWHPFCRHFQNFAVLVPCLCDGVLNCQSCQLRRKISNSLRFCVAIPEHATPPH